MPKLMTDNKPAASERAPITPTPMSYQKYRPYAPVALKDRRWPDQVITQAPIWCSVDLRDGNQALLEPMNPEEKLQMFELLLGAGFKEIEVGFPAASQTDFDFVRKIIEANLIPSDVTIQVLCQARTELIERTAESLRGAKRAIFHLYNSTSTLQRQVVFEMSRDQIVDLALAGTRDVKRVVADLDGDITLEYSPESFTGTELDFALRISEAVCDEWGATPERQVIINLPATVEMSTPNIYADQIEWFGRHFKQRERIILSLHTHNDRGTGVAASELGVMAGADRVEGTLFGNGERTGNVDIITLAMNLYSQGVNPELSLHRMRHLVEVAEAVNKLPVHPRHPYAGELVFTAFSGSHQDAIRKGMAKMEDANHWQVPYLPIDPADVESSYRETVRVNSQSGKGGVAFILEHHFGVNLTRDHLIEFAQVVQQCSEASGGELLPDQILQAFRDTYHITDGHYQLVNYQLSNRNDEQHCAAEIKVGDAHINAQASGGGPIDAFVRALGASLNEPFALVDYHEQALGEGSSAEAIALVSIRTEALGASYGIGISKNTVTASFEAIISAVNRHWDQRSDAAASQKS